MIFIDKNDFYFDSDSDKDTENVPKPSKKLKVSNFPSCEKSGWLKKQSDNIIKSWNWRYFTLKDSKLSYYHKPTDVKPSGVINFNQVSSKLELISKSKPTMISISILGVTYSLKLKSSSSYDLIDWANHIQVNIDSSEGKVKRIPLVSIGDKAWKYERISEYYFRTMASTGDIVLFRSKDIGSIVQRGITRSKYDHVAMILCYASGKICLLEATHTDGVAVLPWTDFIDYKWHLSTQRLVYRKLNFERTDENLLNLEKFVKNVKGKAFKFSPKKIIKKSTKNPGEEDNFFCSELLASAYKVLGILPEDKSSSSYLPGNFSEDKNLELIGATLGPEQVIDFDL